MNSCFIRILLKLKIIQFPENERTSDTSPPLAVFKYFHYSCHVFNSTNILCLQGIAMFSHLCKYILTLPIAICLFIFVPPRRISFTITLGLFRAGLL